MTNKKNHYLLIVGVGLLILSLPFILTRPAISNILNFSQTGQIGDTIGGITAPFMTFLGAVLVYLSFQQQIKANEIQRDALRNEIKRNEQERKYSSIIHDINNLRADINDFSFHGQTIVFGVPALYELEKLCRARSASALLDDFHSPIFKSFYFLIASSDNILNNIQKSNLNEDEKRDLQEKLIYLYSSKISSHAILIIKAFQAKQIKHPFIDMLSNAEERLRTFMVENNI